MVDIIIEVKTKKLKDCSIEAKMLFGKGGFSAEQFAEFEAEGTTPKDENLLGYVNTPLIISKQGKAYTTVRIDKAFGEAIKEIGETVSSKYIKIIGEVDDDQPFMVEVDDFDIDGNPAGTRMQEVGQIA